MKKSVLGTMAALAVSALPVGAAAQVAPQVGTALGKAGLVLGVNFNF
jgi:hypothetical protein